MNRAAFLLLPLALLLQAVALVLIVRAQMTALALSAHLAGAVLWGFGAAPLLPVRTHRSAWQSAAWAAAFPLGGALAFLVFAAILRRPAVDRSTKGYVVWNEESHDSGWGPPASGAGLSIVEILQSPRIQLRRNAVLALRDLDPQLAIPLLRKGLQDSDEQVRIYAQNILSSMLEKFEAGIKQLEQRVASGGFDPIVASRLAEQYFELVYLDVAGDEETAAHYLGKALDLLERAAEASPQDGPIALLGFKYALRARDVAAARRWLARVEATRHEPQHVLPWRMELAFLEGDWPRLRSSFAEFRRAGYLNPRIDELATFWLRAPAATS
jgi:hypothetical protein